MSSDLQQLTELFDAKVQSFEGPAERRFQVLLPFKQGIVRLREKNASSRTIAELLKQLGVTVSHNTIARFCRELALLMHGEVGVNSEPGQGSQFWAELPLPTAQAPAPVAEAADDSDVTLGGAEVLLVEDNPVNMMIAVAMLERWGVCVTQAGDGRQALDAVLSAAGQGRRFDAVLMDVQMPVMSGYEATRALRESDAGRRLPIIALTAAALVTERQQALEAGMDDFLTKPIDAGRLRAALARWVRAGRA